MESRTHSDISRDTGGLTAQAVRLGMERRSPRTPVFIARDGYSREVRWMCRNEDTGRWQRCDYEECQSPTRVQGVLIL